MNLPDELLSHIMAYAFYPHELPHRMNKFYNRCMGEMPMKREYTQPHVVIYPRGRHKFSRSLYKNIAVPTGIIMEIELVL